MSKKILLIGGSGTIGFQFLNNLKTNSSFEIEYTFCKNRVPIEQGQNFLDITNKESTIELISKINPDLVIHTSAITNVDLCETNHTLADSINVNGTENIIEGCQITHSKLVYVSTSYVFDGKQKEYFENDSTSPSTYYGITKEKSEKLLQKSGLNFLILRTDQPYCWTEKWQKDNSVMRVIQHLQLSKTFEEITDWYSNPTYVPNFVDATIQLINKNSQGIYHLTGPDFISRYSWSLLVCEIFNLDKELLKPISAEKLNLSAQRPRIKLNSQKIFDDISFRMIDVKEGLEQMSQLIS